jgi:cystathionine gamma-synthase/methionine-gamma-lyase
MKEPAMAESRCKWGFGTRLVHTGAHQPAPQATPTIPPLYMSSTYIHGSAEELDQAFATNDLVYSRHGNPTVRALEAAVTAAEGGRGSVAFASGMAALHAAILAAGTPRGATQPALGRILGAQDLYGASRTLILDFFGGQGVAVDFCDMCDLAAVEAHLRAAPPDVVVLEPISNPLLKVADVSAITQLAHDVGARLVVDNTIPSPYLLRPIEHGADLVVHSATKYLGGHGDALAGVVVAARQLPLDSLGRYARLLGGVLSGFDARLIARGMQTLALRMKQHCSNALAVARWLQERPEVRRVYYPGLPGDPGYAVAQRLFCGSGGGMVSFELAKNNRAAAYRFMDSLELVLPATSLGDVFSLVSYPPISSHRDVEAAERERQGIGEGLLRLSVGIEEPDDIISDLERGLLAANA